MTKKDIVKVELLQDTEKFKKGEFAFMDNGGAKEYEKEKVVKIINEEVKRGNTISIHKNTKGDEKEKFNAFVEVCITTRKYFWEYTPKPFLIKKNGVPVELTDAIIKKHIKGELSLGIASFKDNENVTFGLLDFDVHGLSEKARELKLTELGNNAKKLKEFEDDFLTKQRQQLAEDIPKITKELDRLGYLFFINSSGSEGKHLRLYSNKPINAKIMRYFLLDLQKRILKEVRHEVFPKQEILDENTPFGNQSKTVLSIHPKTKRLAGVIINGEILDRKESLKFIVGFSKKILKAKEIIFKITPEMEQEFKKVKLSDTDLSKLNTKGVPHYCRGFEEVAGKQILPSGKATRHDYLDTPAFLYGKEHPEVFKNYKEIQGRDSTAFNKCEGRVWSCSVIHKYLRENEGKGIEKWIDCCQHCPHMSASYLPDLKPLIECKDDKEKQTRIIMDIIKTKCEEPPLILNKIITEINLVTGIKGSELKKQLEYEQEKIEGLQAQTDETIKRLKKEGTAKKKIELVEILINDAETKTDEELKEFIKLQFEFNPKLARYLCVLLLQRNFRIITDFRTDVIKAYDEEDKYFKDIGAEILKSKLTTDLNLNNTRNTSQEVLHLLRTLTYIHDEDMQKASPLNLIPFKNGVLDLNTMKLLEHNPLYLFDFQIPINYDPNTKCPKIDKFLHELVEEGDVGLLYDMFAMALYRVNFLEKLFVLTGDGSNGKSRVLNLLETFLGNENVSSITLKQLTEDKFAVARTYKKLANVGADIGNKPIEDSSMLKSSCSSDRISGQFKFGQIFDFTPSALQIFSANNPPIFYDDSLGMYRRVELIRFSNIFGNQKDMEENPDVKLADPNILNKITDPTELSGLLNEAIKHLKNILESGELSVVKSMFQLKKDYTKYANNTQAFIEEVCEEIEYVGSRYSQYSKTSEPASGFLTIKRMYSKYCEFCDNNKLMKKTKEGFVKRLRKLDSLNLDFGLKDWETNPENKERSVRGIKFKELLELPEKVEIKEEIVKI